MGHHVCQQNVDIRLLLNRAGTGGKQESLGPGDTLEATHWVGSTRECMGMPVPQGRSMLSSECGKALVPFNSVTVAL